MNKQIVLDIETTGLNNNSNKFYLNHKIIEICAIEIKKRKITNNIFHKYLNPCRKIDYNAYKIHKIKDSFLKNKPKFNNISTKLIKFIKNSDLIIHNSKFDIKFIEYEFKLINKKIKIKKICNIIDTLKISRKMFPGKKNDLNSLCKRYKIDISNRKYHSAIIDTKLLAKLYLCITRKQINIKIKNKINLNLKKKFKKKKIIKYKINNKEKKNHIKYLKYIKKKYNKCIWMTKKIKLKK